MLSGESYFYNFSEWLLLTIPHQRKTCSKFTTKKDNRAPSVNVVWVSFDYLIKYF